MPLDPTPRAPFEAEYLADIREHLGPAVAFRLHRDRPTLCDLIAAPYFLGHDPLTDLP
ncbi:hypothetical protein OG225_07400 [Nocardia sp. NBC_01377]|uniref:hypothetical protein n=1 Tax=Nocardia TaxID=1817 RepID=UPI001C21AD67|nr:hypothetical protein [Nocardia noduli]